MWKDDVKEVEDILRFVIKENIEGVYAKQWLIYSQGFILITKQFLVGRDFSAI